MWIITVGIVSIAVVVVALLLILSVLIQKRKHTKARIKEESSLQGVSAGISARLHSVYPNSEWRWVCRPINFATNKGIARIEVKHLSNKKLFMDVCLGENGFMALHMINAADFANLVVDIAEDTTPSDFSLPTEEGSSISPEAPTSNPKPHDEETVNSWYNIVLIDKLTEIIDDLHSSGLVCLYINQDGAAYTEKCSGPSIYTFCEMPDTHLWEHITDNLSAAGLYAEVEEDNCIFISWA